MADTKRRLTTDDADQLNHAAKVDAIRNSIGVSKVAAESALAALRRAEYILPSDCEVIEPGYEKFGPCTRWLGHEDGHYVVEDAFDRRRPEGSHVWDY